MNHNRRSIRLRGYDYSRVGAYAVTICTHNRDCLFGEISGGKMRLNGGGRMVEWSWGELPVRFDHIDLDEFVVMPNHVHGIFMLHRRGEPCVRPGIEPDVRPDIAHGCNSGLRQSGQQQSGEYKIRPYKDHDSTGDKTMGEHMVRPHKDHDSTGDKTMGEYKIRPYKDHDSTGDKTMGEDKVRPYKDHDSTGDKTMGEHMVRPYGTLPDTVGRVVQTFKSITTHKYITGVKQYGWPPFPGKLWQRNYYERIIRTEDELQRIREYIVNNPVKWELDRENPTAAVNGRIDMGGDP